MRNKGHDEAKQQTGRITSETQIQRICTCIHRRIVDSGNWCQLRTGNSACRVRLVENKTSIISLSVCQAVAAARRSRSSFLSQSDTKVAVIDGVGSASHVIGVKACNIQVTSR